ncbi:MAG: Na+/H+ antiporter [Candidatus Velthaea sp.]|jgi:CPA1 family monovalent cation:H+ antiporter
MIATDSIIFVLVALLVTIVPLVALAKRVNISYPIVLVVAGLFLGFVPGLPKIQLDPNVVLLIFLPPLLYWESITAPTDVMLENAGQIGLLAIGLVVATTIAVAGVAHAVIPGMSWAAAFVLGAIVSPTDELAAVPVLEYFRLPRHVIAIIDGESLLNDATALVIYAAAVSAVSTGAFAPGQSLLGFVGTVAGSLALGYAAGWLGVELWRRIKDQQLQSVISVVLPFVAYLPAEKLGLSGVLAVVTAGVYVNRRNPRVMTAAARTQIVGFWNTVVFLANTALFLVVGLQLHDVALTAFRNHPWQLVIGYAAAVNAVLIIVRLALAVLGEYAPTVAPADHAAPDWKHALIVAWSGLRGAVSLAAALAIPLLLPNGTPFPERDLIIFVTFSVILVTLVGGGLTLPSVVRWLHVEGGTEEQDEMRRALIASSEAALARIDELETDGRIDADHAEALRAKFTHKRDLQQGDADHHAAQHVEVERELIAAQRNAIIQMRERGEIDNVVLRRLQADLDAAATRGVLNV